MFHNFQKSFRTCLHPATLCLVLVVMCAPAFAAEEKLRLVCTYSNTWDLKKNEHTNTTGEEVFVINGLTKSEATLIMAHGEVTRPFVGTQTEAEINGLHEWSDESIKLKEELKINRYTGGFSIGFYLDGKLGLIHYGNCRATDKPKF